MRSLFIVGLLLLFVQSFCSTQMVFAENLDRYWSVLTGIQQVPTVNTEAHGFVGLKFKDDVNRLVFIVNVENIGNITGIKLYSGEKNQNGTTVLDLLNGTREVRKKVDKLIDVTQDGQIRGTLSIGGATKDDLQGMLKGKSMSDLHALINSGTIYIDITTQEFPHGEIRGNSFIGIDRLFPDFTDFKWS